MKKVVVTEQALRELIVEALDSSSYIPEPKMVKVNDVVDPSAADTDPMNPDYKPQDNVELDVAFKRMTQGMSDDDAPKVFDVLKGALDGKDDKSNPDKRNEKDKQNNMDSTEGSASKGTTGTTGTKPGTRSGTTQHEGNRAVVREFIQAVVDSEPPKPRKPSKVQQWLAEYIASSSVATDPADEIADDDEDEDLEAKKKRELDVIFSNIAKEFNWSVAGAKQFVDKAVARFRFVSSQLPNGPNLEKDSKIERTQMDIAILQSFKDYLEQLRPHLSPGDFDFLQNHPGQALEMDGWREWFNPHLDTMMSKEWVNEDGSHWLGRVGIDGSMKRHYQFAPVIKPDYGYLPFDKDEEGNNVYDFDENEKIHEQTLNRAFRALNPASADTKFRHRNDLRNYMRPIERRREVIAALKAAKKRAEHPPEPVRDRSSPIVKRVPKQGSE